MALLDVFPDPNVILDPLPIGAGLLVTSYAGNLPAAVAAQYLIATMAELDETDRRLVLRAVLDWQG